VKYLNILEEIDRVMDSGWQNAGQFCLQGVRGNPDIFYGARKGSDMDHTEDEFREFHFDMPYTNKIIEDLGLVRTRVMIIEPKSCLTYHTDPSKRIHIPLITNEKCFFMENLTARHLELGKIHEVDTTKPHTSINASTKRRIHLVGVI